MCVPSGTAKVTVCHNENQIKGQTYRVQLRTRYKEGRIDSHKNNAYFPGSLLFTKNKHRHLFEPQVASVDQEEKRGNYLYSIKARFRENK